MEVVQMKHGINYFKRLKQWVDTKIIKWDTTRASNRDLRDPSSGETEVLKVVVPCVRYNPDTGQMENWDNFTSDITFTGEITLEDILHLVGAAAIIDTDGNIVFQLSDAIGASDFIVEDSLGADMLSLDSDGRLDIAGNIVTPADIQGRDVGATDDLTSGDDVIVGDDLVMGNSQRIVLDDDADSYIVTNGDDDVSIYIAGTHYYQLAGNTVAHQAGIWVVYLAPAQFRDYIRIAEIAAPGSAAGYGTLYCVDNAGTTELWFKDDAGAATQLA